MLGDTQMLLAAYLENGSEVAFGELVARYINLVYSTALRRAEGNADLAKDITQTVFIDLARKARGLSRQVMLGGWLHRRTCHVAASLMRSERRRQDRERQVAEMNDQPHHSEANLAQVASVLDEAIGELAADERTVVLLRFFEQHDFRSVGKAVGISEDAARMRTTRALEKLQLILKRHGAAFSVASLTTALSAGAVTSAPAGLAAGITGTALASAAAAGTTTTLFNLFIMSKLKVAAVSAVVVAGLATPLVVQQLKQRQLIAENESLRGQLEQVAALQVENDRLSNLLARAEAERAASSAQGKELLRLRGELGVMKRKMAETPRPPVKTPVEPQEKGFTPEEYLAQAPLAKLTYAKNWMLAFFLFSEQNQNQFPTNFDQALAFLPENAKGEHNLQPQDYASGTPRFGLTPDRFEIMYSGPINQLASPQNVIVVREKDAWQNAEGAWVKTYGFADGHTEIHKAVNGNFEEWERQRMASTSQPVAR